MALASTSARGSFDGPLLASSESASHSCSASSASIGPIRSRGLYAILYVIRLLAGPELDDAKVREAEETDVRGHVRVNFLEGGFVDELDDEHNRQPAAKARGGLLEPRQR